MHATLRLISFRHLPPCPCPDTASHQATSDAIVPSTWLQQASLGNACCHSLRWVFHLVARPGQGAQVFSFQGALQASCCKTKTAATRATKLAVKL